jgi:hypothetical protein
MSNVLCTGCKHYDPQGKASLDLCSHPINKRTDHRGDVEYIDKLSKYCDQMNSGLNCPLKEEA